MLKGSGQVGGSAIQVGSGRDEWEVGEGRLELGLEGGTKIVLGDVTRIKACVSQSVRDEPDAVGRL